ncbi:MAG: beta-glucosidase, partial [Clostridia bacterium]
MSSKQNAKPSRTTLKKVFLNISVALLAIFYLLNVIANENAGQINAFLGIGATTTVYTGKGDPTEYPRYFESEFDSVAQLKAAGLAKVREVEAEGAVLLKNNNHTLPLSGKDVSLFGATAISPVYGGTGSGAVSSADAPTYTQVLSEAGFNVINTALLDWYKA